MANLKLKLKLNGLEFEIEGEEITVKEEFEKFKLFVTEKFVDRNVLPTLDKSEHDNSRGALIGELTEAQTGFPVLIEIVKKDLPKSESEWVLIYAFYSSNFGQNFFTTKDIKDNYESTGRKNESRLKNLDNSIKKLLSSNFIKFHNDTEYIFLDKGREKIKTILYPVSKKKKTSSSETRVSKEVAGNNTKPKPVSVKDVVALEFDICPAGKKSLQDFLNEKKPSKSARERILVIAFYMKNELGMTSFSESHIEYVYRALKLGDKPLHLRQVLTDIKNKDFRVKPIEGGNWEINRMGEIFVEEKLPRPKNENA